MTIQADRKSIIHKAKKLPEDIAVIECEWDGDSSGWHIRIMAIEQSQSYPYREHLLGFVGHGMGEYHDFMRALAGKTPPYPEGALAKDIGQEIADLLGVPLYFPSPDKPAGDEVPRWKDWKEGRVSSIPIHLIDPNPIISRFSTSDVAVVEAYWDYYHRWYPRMAVVILNSSANSNDLYTVYDIGKLYWDEHDKGKTIHKQQIPNRSPVQEAKHLGAILTEKLNTGFYFEASDNPQWHIPRWVDLHNTNSNK